VGFLFDAGENLGRTIKGAVMMTTFLVAAQNTRDILARVIMLFHRRAIPIYSLTMLSGENVTLKMKITAGVEESRSLRIVADLYKLVDVRLINVITARQPHEAILPLKEQ
jgi:acetolactate synthase small subunit